MLTTKKTIIDSVIIKSFLVISLSWGCIYSQTAYPGWSHNAAIIINTTSTGANIPGTASETNFPLLVQLEQGSIDLTQAKDGLEDLRFSSSSNVPLNYEIESWDATTGNAVVWVKLPTIAGNALQTIYVYWGNDGADSESSGAGVFETTNGFSGVWHLSEEPGNSADGFKDATSNAAHGTGFNMNTHSAGLGPVGNAIDLEFDKNQYILASQESLFDYTNSMTASFWIKVETFTEAWQRMLCKANDSWRIQRVKNEDNVIFGLDGPGHMNSTSEVNDGNWHYISMIMDGTQKYIYLDGVIDNSGSINNDLNLNDDPVGIGVNSTNLPDGTFDGLMDEVRLAGVGRSADWVKLSYENQKKDRVMVGPPKEAGCVKNFGVVAATVTANEGENFVVKGNAMCADQYHWVEVNGGTETYLDPGLNVVRNYKRLTGDKVLTWRLKALYGSTWETSETTVTIKELIPNPEFVLFSTLPDPQSWDGQGAFEILLTLTNQAAIAAQVAPYNETNIEWTFTGARVYKTWTDSSVIINRAFENGTFNVETCLDNKGEVICQSFSHPVTLPTVEKRPPETGTPGKLKIFVLAGQSNMEGHGQTHGVDFAGSLDWLLASSEHASNYQHLMDGGSPKVFDDVWVYYPIEDIGNYTLKELMMGPLSPNFGVKGTSSASIGPEYAMGIQLGDYFDDQVLLIKAAWGGHSLGEKFRPPGAGGILGPSYKHMLEIVEDVTSNLKTYFPDYDENGYEIMGLGWHQGYNDQFCDNCDEQYAVNMGTLIDDLRREWNVPRLPVSIGESGMICTASPKICEAQQETSTFSGYDGNVAFTSNLDIYTEAIGGGAGFHWYESFHNYYQVGDRMGQAMVGLLAQSVDNQSAVPVKDFNLQVQVFADFVKLNVFVPDNYTVIISNIKGQKIKSFLIKNSSGLIFSRNGLKNGIYSIRVKSRQNIRSRLLVLL